MAKKRIALFDLDDTLTAPRSAATPEMLSFLQELRRHVHVGIVGGSNLDKIREQLGHDADAAYDFVFAENGLVSYAAGRKLDTPNLKTHMGEANIQRLIDFVLRYIADLRIPVKRGTFVEFRNGMINVSPIGRNCSRTERNEFEAYDKEKGVRRDFVAALEAEFGDLNLKYSIGGQISFDVFPKGWDKTFCLRFLEDFEEVHFFGDKTYEGGNDYEIYVSERTVGHSVGGPDDTMRIARELFIPKEKPKEEMEEEKS